MSDRAPGWWRSAALPAAAVAIAAAVALLVVQWIALRTVRGQQLDENVTQTAVAATGGEFLTSARMFGDLSFDVALVACLLVLGFALFRFGRAYALGAAVLIGGANITTQALKHLLLQRTETAVVSPNSLPSGHVTVVAALVLASLLVMPAWMRPLGAVAGAAWIALMGTATILARWHRLSDVVAAVLVCLIWAGVVAAVLARRRPLRVGSVGALIGPWLTLASTAAVATTALAAWAMSRPDSAGLGGNGAVGALVSIGVTGVSAGLVVAVWSRLLAVLSPSPQTKTG